jgi:hypothetical protein
MAQHSKLTARKIVQCKNTAYRTRIKNMRAESKQVQVQTVQESPANDNFNRVPGKTLVATLPILKEKTYFLSSREYDVCKNGVTPSFSALTKENRTLILSIILSVGNIPSRLLSDATGMLARQIGQIRRWHNKGWQTQTPNKIFNSL